MKTEVPDDAVIAATVAKLSAALLARGWTMAAAESCTGGWIAKCCTDRAGSSAWFERGFVSYSDAAKHDSLGVDAQVLQFAGAVSEAVVCEMTAGALEKGNGNLAVAVSGIAGPGGGTHFKPLGTVWIAWQQAGSEVRSAHYRLDGDRYAVRFQAVEAALQGLIELVRG